MKKLIALTLALIMVCAMMTGCRNPMDNGETQASGEDTTPSNSTVLPSNSSEPTNTTNSPNITLPTGTDPSTSPTSTTK